MPTVVAEDAQSVTYQNEDGTTSTYPRQVWEEAQSQAQAEEQELLSAATGGQPYQPSPEATQLANDVAPAPAPAPASTTVRVSRTSRGEGDSRQETAGAPRPARSSSDAMGQAQGLIEKQGQVAGEAADIEAQADAKLANEYERSTAAALAGMERGKAAHMERTAKLEQDMLRIRQENEQLARVQPDPNRWWSSRSKGQQVGAVLAAAMGGVLELQTGRPNSAMGFINKQIDDDLQIQKESLSNRRQALSNDLNLYQHLLQRSSSEFEADQRFKMFMLDRVHASLEKQAMGAKSAAMRKKAEEAKLGVQAEYKKAEASILAGKEEMYFQAAQDRAMANAKAAAEAGQGGPVFMAPEGGHFTTTDGGKTNSIPSGVFAKDEKFEGAREMVSSAQSTISAADELLMMDPQRVAAWDDEKKQQFAIWASIVRKKAQTIKGVPSDFDTQLIQAETGGDPTKFFTWLSGKGRKQVLRNMIALTEGEVNDYLSTTGYRWKSRRISGTPNEDPGVMRHDEQRARVQQGPLPTDTADSYHKARMRMVDSLADSATKEVKTGRQEQRGQSNEAFIGSELATTKQRIKALEQSGDPDGRLDMEREYLEALEAKWKALKGERSGAAQKQREIDSVKTSPIRSFGM